MYVSLYISPLKKTQVRTGNYPRSSACVVLICGEILFKLSAGGSFFPHQRHLYCIIFKRRFKLEAVLKITIDIVLFYLANAR